jgi:hypothetical protein
MLVSRYRGQLSQLNYRKIISNDTKFSWGNEREGQREDADINYDEKTRLKRGSDNSPFWVLTIDREDKI